MIPAMKNGTRSLLRYPGSKARLTKFIAQAIKLNEYNRPIFVEPFCGGSSVSIALLERDLVEEVIINDIDPIVASLWKCVFSRNNSRWLAEVIMGVPLTLDYWHYQKHLNPKNLREAALKCLYLNRTSFSGVLHDHAGPIGGQSQKNWTIGCRFNREKLSSRILELSQFSKRVRSISHQSWVKVCETWKKEDKAFFYLDPPFYHKAKRLYRFIFNDNEHRLLHEYLNYLQSPWILSYDNAQEVRKLYDDQGFNARIIDNTYSAHPMGGNSFVGREVVYSNLRELPQPLNEESEHSGLSVRNYETHNNYLSYPMRIPMDQVTLTAV
jgi:DNA adenine methylase